LFGFAHLATENSTKQANRAVVAAGKDQEQTMRFKYSPKASKQDRDEGCEALDGRIVVKLDQRRAEYREDRNTEPMPAKNHHPTVKPTDLMRYLCRLVTPPDGVVLDPFTGSGSTGKGAVLEGFRFIGIELQADHVAIAEARLAWALGQYQDGLALEASAAGEIILTARERATGQMGLFGEV